jgi:hypothetical protein
MTARALGFALAVLGLVGCTKSGGEAQTSAAVDYGGSPGRMYVYNPVGSHPDPTSDTGGVETGMADTGAADTGTADTGTADTGTADTGTADIPELRLEIGDDEWTFTLRSGATPFAWSASNGLVVDDSTLLPATVTKGSTGTGVEVTEVGEFSVWYGLFPDVASASVSEGRFAGEWAFARDIGPIRAFVVGTDWELVYYQ